MATSKNGTLLEEIEALQAENREIRNLLMKISTRNVKLTNRLNRLRRREAARMKMIAADQEVDPNQTELFDNM